MPDQRLFTVRSAGRHPDGASGTRWAAFSAAQIATWAGHAAPYRI